MNKVLPIIKAAKVRHKFFFEQDSIINLMIRYFRDEMNAEAFRELLRIAEDLLENNEKDKDRVVTLTAEI